MRPKQLEIRRRLSARKRLSMPSVFESVRTLGVDLRFLPTGLGNREISRVGAAVRALPRLEESVLRVYDCGCSSTIEG